MTFRKFILMYENPCITDRMDFDKRFVENNQALVAGFSNNLSSQTQQLARSLRYQARKIPHKLKAYVNEKSEK